MSEPLLLSAFYLEVLGEIRFVQRRYPESVAVFEQVLDINPNYARVRMWLAAALAEEGDLEGAEWEATELRVLSPGFSLERLEFAFPFKDPRELERYWTACANRDSAISGNGWTLAVFPGDAQAHSSLPSAS